MTKGIIIFALGHRNYLSMAINLAASLKCNGAPDICLLTSKETAVEIIPVGLFERINVVDESLYMQNGKVVFNNAMIHMYDLSPYDCTIKLDADMIWLKDKNVNTLFASLENVDFTVENLGHGWKQANSVWAKIEDIKVAYHFNTDHKLYKIFGEFVYFSKSDKMAGFFKTIKEIYNNPEVECAAFSNGSMTDELAYQLACMKTGIYPHQDNFTPIFNLFLGRKSHSFLYTYQLAKYYYALSIGGNLLPTSLKVNYNSLVSLYFNTLGLQSPFLATNKLSFLPERKKL